MLKHRTSPTQLKIDVWKGCRPHTIGHRFSAPQHYEDMQSSTRRRTYHVWFVDQNDATTWFDTKLFQPKKRRSNAFKYPGRALLSVQITTSLTSFSKLTKPDRHKPHKLKDSVLNSEFQKNKEPNQNSKSIFEFYFTKSSKEFIRYYFRLIFVSVALRAYRLLESE